MTRNIPTSVYRIQLNHEFNFKKAAAQISYFEALGLDCVYCSPYFESFRTDGYDVTNPLQFNHKLGSKNDFQKFCDQLASRGLMQVIDVVPNHMGFKGGRNLWWQDVLENGPHSEYACFFDIDWNSEKEELKNKVLFPVLYASYGIVLEKKGLKLIFKNHAFEVRYADYRLPICPETYEKILGYHLEDLSSQFNDEDPTWKNFQKLLELYQNFPQETEKRKAQREECLALFKTLYKHPKIRRFIETRLQIFNGQKNDPTSFDLLHDLLQAQYFRLSYWKVANYEINYRRFFNINEFIALKIENREVFETHHKWIFELVRTGKIQGLRIDHPDGLYDPVAYFKRIRAHFPNLFLIVEKILMPGEGLPQNWEVDGTVGYEFINILNGIFIEEKNEDKLSAIYEDFLGQKIDFASLLFEKKKQFILFNMVGELNALGKQLDKLSEAERDYRDLTRHDLIEGLQELIAAFPVYRSYISPNAEEVERRDAHSIRKALKIAKGRNHYLDPLLFHFLKKVLLLRLKPYAKEKKSYINFICRLQQVTAPVMAKGLEDTCFYIFNRLISTNEVGSHGAIFGIPKETFHQFNLFKKEKWPYGFLPTSTHDTKRGEDVRMRINVLSEIPQQWHKQVNKWKKINDEFKTTIDAASAPSSNLEYFFYQTLLGAWPLEMETAQEEEHFKGRIWNYMEKAMREGGIHTNWTQPNLAYEDYVKNFTFKVLDKNNTRFRHTFIPFQHYISRLGAWNSLSALTLKFGSCGVVDTYQGCELWNYSLVDPDNRRPVDYNHYNLMLEKAKALSEDPLNLSSKLLEHFVSYEDGLIKMFLTMRGLFFRKNNRELFLEGEYIPLEVRGTKKHHLIAFMRKINGKMAIFLGSRLFATLINKKTPLPIGACWQDTKVLLPKKIQMITLKDLFTGKTQYATDSIRCQEALASLPFSILHN